MPGADTGSRIVRFGCYEVDLAAGQLRKRGVRIRLRDQPFRVLASLVERAGQVVTREELRQRLWPAEVFVDFDNNLNTAIGRLREALDDSAAHPRFIETLPRHGYRFIAQISEAAAAPASATRPSVRLAVLPFLNSSGDPAQEYFSDAITDEIITELSVLAPTHLVVIARTTAMRYKRRPKDVLRIGRELSVDYVVEGGVRRADDRVNVTVQLIRVSDQAHVFANRYDAALRDVLTLEESIAHEIARHIDVPEVADELRAALAAGRHGARKPTEDPAAYNLYIQGRFQLAKVTSQGFARAKEHFEAAIARDPEFALAHDALAEVYWQKGYFGLTPPREAFSTGVFHALRALEIDSMLAETHALLAQLHKQLDYDWPEVEREMARALELNPTSPIVRVRYAANALMPHGRLEEAVAELERALEWDPLSTFAQFWLAVILVLWHRYDRSIEEAERLLELDPEYPWGYMVVGSCRREQGRFDESIAANRKAVQLSGGSAALTGWLGLSLGLGGHTAEARAVLAELHARALTAYVPPTAFAWIYIGLRETDAAFEWLDRAIDGCDQLMMPIKSYAFLDPFRADPRFAALLRKMKLEG